VQRTAAELFGQSLQAPLRSRLHVGMVALFKIKSIR
jgi:hypothetical protein